MKPRFPIGLTFTLYSNSKRHCKIIDILTTTNSFGIVVKIEYLIERAFCGQMLTELYNDVAIARSLPTAELAKYSKID